MATMMSMKTAVEINEAEGRATLSIWLNNEAEAYTIRVEPLTAEQIEDRRIDAEADDTHVIRDGYSEDQYFGSFEDAISKAWDYYQEGEAQHFNEARGID
jgi:hypothetical protein